VNDAPLVNDLSFSINENSANGTLVGTVPASDQDIADTLTYSITNGNDSGAFVINTATGEITVNDSSQLDFENSPGFSLTVQVTDMAGDNATAAITINLNDLSDTPLIPSVDNPNSGTPLPPPLIPVPGLVNIPPEIQTPPLALEPFVVTGGGGSHGNLGMPATAVEPVLIPEPVVQAQIPTNSPASTPEPVDSAQRPETLERTLQQAVNSSRSSDALWLSLERMNNEMDGSQLAHPLLMAATRGIVWTFSAGFLTWMLRAGSLLATALSSMPMWRWIDPLPILPVKRRERDKRKKKMQAEAEQEARAYSGMAAVLDGTDNKTEKTRSREDGAP
ncbi:hypothetical protein MNBD_GAMMA13-57, partial [hydrothermal vent metagenome]